VSLRLALLALSLGVAVLSHCFVLLSCPLSPVAVLSWLVLFRPVLSRLVLSGLVSLCLVLFCFLLASSCPVFACLVAT
jgi:hypothetical protein